MADNAAQSIKDLQSRLEALDKQLFVTNKNFELLGKTITESMNNGITTMNNLYSKLKAKDIVKMKVIVEKEQIENDIAKLQTAIKRGFGQVKIGDQILKGKDSMMSALADYESMMKQLPKSAAEAYDYVLKTVNAISGDKKGNKGTALGQARAKLINERLETTQKISKLEDEIAEKQEKLGKYKEGSKNWQKTKDAIDNANKSLQQYQDKLNRLQGKSVQDLGAKALREQEKNFYKLNMLLNERRKLEAQIKAQGGTASDVQSRYQKILNASIQRTVNSMRALGKAYEGVTQKAGQNTIDARMRRTKASIDSINASLNKTNRDMNALIPTLTRLASAFGVVFSVRGLVQFGKKLIETRGQFELQQVAMRSILQNKQLADEIWDKTMKAALQSPFTAMQLTTYTKQLAAYRIETEKLFDTTKRLADVSAGLGVDMQRLILAYGQVKAANYLRASEIRQFTEAGVNILGELSTYLTDMKGEMISTAQVMEMVQKRMVTFADVEAIFKRMTDQGGIFYNMQYVQSQTVKGQIAKLHDAYDQMLNSIGKANEGVLKDMIAALNSIVQNWRTWAVVLKSIAWGSLVTYLSKVVLGLAGVRAMSESTTKAMVKLKAAMEGLGRVMPMMLAVGTVTALISLSKRMRDVNREIDEQNYKLYETRKNFEDLKFKIESNNRVLEDETSSQNELNKAQKDNMSIMQKLQNEYPQLASQMEIATETGIIAMNDALDINIRKLNEQMTILNAMKTQSMFSDTDQKNLSDFELYLSRTKVQFVAMQNEAKLRMNILEQERLQGTEIYKIYQQVDEIVEKMNLTGNVTEAVTQFEKLEEVVRQLNFTNRNINKELNGRAEGARMKWFGSSPLARTLGQGNIFGASFDDLWGTEGKAVKALEGVDAFLMSAYKKGIQDNAEYLEEINEQYNGNIEKFIIENAGRLNEGTLEGINNANEIFIKTLNPQTQEYKDYLNKYFNAVLGIDEMFLARTQARLMNLIDRYQNTDWAVYEGTFNSEWMRALKIQMENDIKNLQGIIDVGGIDFFGVAKGDGGTREPDIETNKGYFSKMIPLIREMRAEYDKLSKSAYNATKSQFTVREAYREAVEEILSKAGVTPEYDFTTNEGMIEALKKVKEFAVTLGDEYAAQVEKFIGQLTAETEINVVVKERKGFDDQIQKLFDNYDLTLDLEKLELPTDELEGIFKFDVTSLDDLRKAVEDYKKEMEMKGHDPKDVEEQIKKYNDKIDEMERKALVNRLKTYTQYLAKGRDEAVKIHLEELRMIAELDKDRSHYTDAQYDDIVEQIKKETNQKLAKNRWQDFKESDFYVTMFQDLEHVSQVSIDIMLKKLKDLRDEIKDLDPTQVKEITKSIEKLEKITLKRNPVAQFFENIKKSKAWDREGNETLLGELIGTEADLQAEHDRVEKEVLKFQAEFDELSKNGTPQDAAYAKQNLDEAEAELSGINKDLEETEKKIDEINQKENEGYKALKERQQAMVDGVGYFNQMVDAAMTVNQEMMDMMDGVSDASKKLAKDIAEIATNAGLLVKDIAQAIMSEGTDVGAMIDGLIRTWNIIRGWLSAREHGTNEIIEKQTNLLKDLETQLNRVQRAREKAWDTQQLVRYQNELDNTLAKQREAYNAMIKAEKSRKNPDEDLIRQWENALEEIDNMLEDEKEKFIQVFGGIGESEYRSSAQAFVDAWTDAFLETGDGLQGLQEHFDEFLNEWFVKQATMRIAGKMLSPLFEDIDKAVDQYNAGGTNVLMSELNAIREKFGIIAPQLSDALEALAGQWGLGGEGGLSGLAAGIQGMSEEQANILEAYWNSVRGYTASIDMNVSRIVELLGANSAGRDFNPQLQQLELIAKNTAAIQSMFSSVLGNYSQGGRGIKVIMD